MTDIETLCLFVERAPSAKALLDRDVRYLAYSDRWARDYGLDPEVDYRGRSHYDVFPEIGDDWKAVHQKCLAGHVEQTELEPFERADGRTQWLRYEVRPWYRTDGEVAGLVMLTEDLTDQVEAERSARDQAARLATLADAFALRSADDTDAVEDVLERLVGLLGLDIGIVSRIRVEDDRYEVVARAVPEGVEMSRGDVFTLGQTYCSIALEAAGVTAIDHMGASDHRGHPCYGAFGLEAYIGAPVYVGGELFGTLNFSAPAPRATPFTDADRDLVRLAAQWVGGVLETTAAIARHAEAERRAEARGAELALVQSAIPDALVFADVDRRIRRVNPAFDRLFGVSGDDLVGRPTRELYADPEAHAEAGRSRFNAGAATTFDPYVVEYRRADGTTFPGETVGAPVRDASGETVGYLGLVRDVTDRKAMEDALYHQAHYDDLTGVPNRALFMARLEGALARVSAEHGAAVLFIDLDRFKVVNDTLGHSAGDRLLQEVARRLAEVVRPSDVVARLGGDEFAVLLDGLQRAGEATEVAARALEALRRPVEVEGRALEVGASVGVVEVRPGHATPDAVLQEADLAMYDAKAAGRGVAVTYSPSIHEAATRRMRLEMDLPGAAERGELRLAYQPVVRLEDGALSGFEALVRWEHPELGLLYPDAFIGPAEASGHVVEVDRWVLREATRQVAAWKAAYDHDGLLMLSVNCTGRDLLENDYTAEVRAAVSGPGFVPGQLLIEITETFLVEDPQAVARELDALRGQGIRFCIDDFGTGYSSLSVLHDLPVDTIKVDRAFVGKMHDDERSRELVRTVLTLADVLGKTVVAEGVETPGHFAALREMGCALAQGYLFARPLAPEAAERLLATGALPWAGLWAGRPGARAA